MTWIGTYSGKKIDFSNPSVDQIDAQDIAIALSRIPRFAGHTKQAISVAQHCVMVCDACEDCDKLEGLLHDAQEAYMMDCPRPLKEEIGEIWHEIEHRLYRVIAEKFGARATIPPAVKVIDDAILFSEHYQQQPNGPDWSWHREPLNVTIAAWGEDVARETFLDRLNQYSRNRTLIGLVGYAGSGKDEAARALLAQGWTRVSFADPLREVALAIDPYAGNSTIDFRLSDAVCKYGWDDAKRNFPEIRRLLQAIGTEAVRKVIGDSTWINLARKKITEATGPVIVTDVRFANEVETIRGLGGKLIRITRPGVGPVNAHASEDIGGIFCEEIVENDGAVEDLHRKILAAAGMSYAMN